MPPCYHAPIRGGLSFKHCRPSSPRYGEPMKKIPLLVLLVLLGACASVPRSPVSVVVAAPVGSVPGIASLEVVPEPGEVDWAAEQSLRAVGVQVDPASRWRLHASERMIVRVHSNPFPCYGAGWAPYHGGLYNDLYWRDPWFMDPWCSSQVDVRQRRVVTWIVEDGTGQVFWQASSVESSVDRPPMEASSHLATAFARWQSPPAVVP